MATTEARIVITADASGVQRGADTASQAIAGIGRSSTVTAAQTQAALGQLPGQLGGAVPRGAAAASAAIAGIGRASTVSAAQTQAALRQLPAQFTDIATQLAGGQSPLLILLQQGGQIKDSFGGLGNTFRALSGVLTPLRVGVAATSVALGGLVLGAVAGFRETVRLRDTLIATGNAAGQTADTIARSASAISAATGETVRSVRGIITTLVSSSRSTVDVIQSQAQAIARLSSLTGQSAQTIAGQFADQFRAPAEAAARLNEQYNFLNLAQFKRIQQLQQEGKAAEAVNLTNKLLNDQLSVQQERLGSLERGWRSVRNAVSSAVDALFDIGRDQTVGTLVNRQLAEVNRLQAQLEANARTSQGGVQAPAVQRANERLRERLDIARENLRLLRSQQAAEESAAAARSRAAAKNREDIAKALAESNKVSLPKERVSRDPLGDFIAERVLPDDARRQEARVQREEDFVARIIDANNRAGARLIENERERGLALIELDRVQALQRLEQAQISGERLAQAEAGIARAAELATQALNAEIAQGERQRLDSQAAYLQQLVDANDRASLQLLSDEQERARALIELDRQLAIRRLDQAKLSAQAREQALEEINRSAAIANQLLAKQTGDELSEFARQAASNIQDLLGSTLTQVLQGDFRNIERLWASTVSSMVAQAAAAQLNRALFGDDFARTGRLGGLLAGLVGSFAGFSSGAGAPAPAPAVVGPGLRLPGRATGGRVQRGMPYVVGELRPELFVPDVSGYVQPDANAGGTRIDYAPVFNINGDVSPQTIALVRAEARAQQDELLRRLQRQGRL